MSTDGDLRLEDYQAMREKGNPFYFNYIFSKKDLQRRKFKLKESPILWFFPTYIQINDGYVFRFKKAFGRIYLMAVEKLPSFGGEWDEA